MHLINDIDENYLLSIDIETVRLENDFDELDELTQSAWEYKNKQSGIVPTKEELKDLWERMASLYAEFSKICAISISFLNKKGDKLICREFYGEDESKILENVKKLLDKIYLADNKYRLIGHATKYFDYPFINKRCVIKSIGIPYILDTAHLKPWENKNIDTNMDIWKMGGTGPGSSLQALCTCLNIPISKVDLVGDEVGKAYFEKEYEKIGRYCSYDTVAVFNIILRIKNKELFKFDDVKYVVEDVDSEESSIFSKIKSRNSFDDEIKKELKSIIKGKKLYKKDKKVLQEILSSVYVRDDFINNSKDTVAVKKSKLQEIEKFVETI